MNRCLSLGHMKIVQISDTHLTAAGGPMEEAFRILARHLADEVQPDLVVHSGDLQFLHPDDQVDRARARELTDLIEARLLVVPGNHDVGEPGPDPWKGITVTAGRVAAHEAVFGPDHWRHDTDEAVLLGIDSELLGSGLHREADQWRWIEETLADLRGDAIRRPVLLFLHRPVWAVSAEAVEHSRVDVGPVARERLLGLLEGVALRAVGCGHVHRYRQVRRGGAIEVWAPPVGFLAPGYGLPEGREELGYVEYEVAGAEVRATFHMVPGIRRITVAEVPGIDEAIEAVTTAGR